MASVQKKYKQHAASKKISVLPIPFHLCLHHSNHSHNFSLAEGNSEDITKIYDSPASPFGGSSVILHTAASIIFLTDIVTSWLKTCSGFLLRIAFTVCSNTLRPGQVGASTLWGVFHEVEPGKRSPLRAWYVFSKENSRKICRQPGLRGQNLGEKRNMLR